MMPTETGFGLIRDDDGIPYAIDLGHSPYADHRVGFDKLAKAFNVGGDDLQGIDRHKTASTKAAASKNMWVKNLKAWEKPFDNGWKKGTYEYPAETRLMVAPADSWDFDHHQEDDLSKSFILLKGADNKWPEMQTAWSPHGFFIRAFSTEARAFTTALAKALKENDVALGTGENLCMGEGRLVVAIASRVPEKVLENISDRQAALASEIEGPSFSL